MFNDGFLRTSTADYPDEERYVIQLQEVVRGSTTRENGSGPIADFDLLPDGHLVVNILGEDGVKIIGQYDAKEFMDALQRTYESALTMRLEDYPTPDLE